MSIRFLIDGALTVKDQDTHFIVKRKLPDGKMIQMRLPTAERHRIAMRNRDIQYFGKALDEALARDQRIAKQKAEADKELAKIREAAMAGIPIEQKIIPPAGKGKPARCVVWIMPWYKRLWRRVKRIFSPTGVILEQNPPTKSMMPPAPAPAPAPAQGTKCEAAQGTGPEPEKKA